MQNFRMTNFPMMKGLLLFWYLALGAIVGAQVKVSELPVLTGGGAAATDVLPIVDVSAGASGSKKITLAELFSTPVPWQGVPITDGYVASAATWNAKEGPITAGTTGQYWRGDKTWQTLDKSAVGLGNVDNTSDASKPVSTATTTALSGKADVDLSNVDPATGRDALEVRGATETAIAPGLRNLKVAASTGTVSVMMIGDSFNIGYYGSLEKVAHIRGAYRCKQVSGGGDSGVTIHSVEFGNADYTKSPDGYYYEIASGGNLTCGHLQYATAGPADQVHYTLFPGTGSAQLQYSYSGGAWTSVGSAIDTTAITTVQCATVALPFGYTNSVRCRITATGGTVNGWIGQGMEGPGVMIASFAFTGQSMAQTMSIGETRWKALLTAYSTDLIISSWADARFVEAAGTYDVVGADNWATDGPFDRAYDWSKVVNSSVDWLFISPHQVKPDYAMATDATLDAAYTAVGASNLWDARTAYSLPYIRSFALDRGEAYVDCYHMFPSWSQANTEGMYESDPTPTVHLSDKGKSYKADFVRTTSGLETIFGPSYNAGGVKVGDGGFFNTTQNFGQGIGIGLYTWNGNTANLFAGTLYSLDPARPDGAGAYVYGSASAVRLGNFAGGSDFPQVDITSGGVRPITNLTGNLGSTSLRFGTVYSGGASRGIATKTTAYTASATDYTLLCDATSAAFTISLPAAASFTGQVYVIKKVDSSGNAVSIDPNSTELIDGTSTPLAISTQWQTRTVQSNGTSWFVIGN
jgi:hypothetical protein